MPRPNLAKWLHIAEAFVPMIVMAAAPEYAPLAGAIVHGMTEAEQIPGASGPEKLAHARNIALAAAAGYNGAHQRDVINLPQFAVVSDLLISRSVDVINAIHALPGSVQNLPPAPPLDFPVTQPRVGSTGVVGGEPQGAPSGVPPVGASGEQLPDGPPAAGVRNFE